MRYEPGKTSHGLAFDPFKSCVVPRPIGWISTRSTSTGDNLAPYSQFTNVTFDPPSVLFCANRGTTGQRKDSVVNAEETGVFCWNMATWELREAVNLSAEELLPEIDEFAHAGLEKMAATQIDCPMVARSPVHFECEYLQTVTIPGNGTMGPADVVFGRVAVVHIDDDFITPDGRLDVLKARPIARMGYYDYTTVDSRFELIIPNSTRLLVGLGGNAAAND